MPTVKRRYALATLCALSLGCTGEMEWSPQNSPPSAPNAATPTTQIGTTAAAGGTTRVPGTGGGGGGGPQRAVLPEFECQDAAAAIDPGPPLLRRLTLEEYVDTVDQTLGVDIGQRAAKALPADGRADGFSNTTYNLKVNFEHVAAYAQLSGAIVADLDLPTFAKAHSSCQDIGKQACVDSLIDRVAGRLWRVPLGAGERTALEEVVGAVKAEGGDFSELAGWLVDAMLQSPRFLYRVEGTKGDGSVRGVDGWAMASRLSYLVWGAPPDPELYEAAGAGELETFDQVKRQADRMLKDPRARAVTRRFAHQWLGLHRVDTLSAGSPEFPDFTPDLKQAMVEETLRTIDHVLWEQHLPVGALFDTQTSFLTPGLATYYGLEDIPKGPGPLQVDLSGEPHRSGLLTHASLLTAGADEASMVGRGLFLMRNLLCADVADPPPGADTTPKPTQPGVSQRQMAQERVEDPGCGGCHGQFEPLAYGLERYDGRGGYHDVDEHGNALRADGSLRFSLTGPPQAFDSAREVGALFAKSEVVEACFTLKFTQFALGRPLLPSDRCALATIRQQVTQGQNDFASLIAAIATSDLMRTLKTEP